MELLRLIESTKKANVNNLNDIEKDPNIIALRYKEKQNTTTVKGGIWKHKKKAIYGRTPINVYHRKELRSEADVRAFSIVT